MEILKLAISLFIIAFIGWNILYLIAYKNTKLYLLEKIFISYGLGLGFLSLEMFVLYFFSIRFEPVIIISPWVFLFIINLGVYIKNRGRGSYKIKGIKDSGNNTFKLLLSICILYEISYAFFRALVKPIEAYDAIAIYAIRSKIFYLSRSIPRDYFYNIGLLFPHPDYPLNIPLSETFVYLFLGNLNDQLVKIIFPLYFVAILGILYFSIRRFGSRTYALIFTFILATIPQFNNFATNAYIDLPLAYYCFAGALFLFYWFKETARAEFLYISAVMTALASWTKNEGLVYCVTNIMLLAAFLLSNRRNIKSKDIMHGFAYVCVISLIILPWVWVKNAAHLVNSDIGPLKIEQFNIVKQSYKIWPIFYEFQRQIFGPKKWNILWIIVMLSAVIYHKKIFVKDQRYITISLMLTISGYVFAYLIGQREIGFLVTTTWSRFMIHFLPLVVYWFAYLLKDEFEREKV